MQLNERNCANCVPRIMWRCSGITASTLKRDSVKAVVIKQNRANMRAMHGLQAAMRSCWNKYTCCFSSSVQHCRSYRRLQPIRRANTCYSCPSAPWRLPMVDPAVAALKGVGGVVVGPLVAGGARSCVFDQWRFV